MHAIRKPYLLLVGDMENRVNAKTALGLRDWIPEDCIGQLRFTPNAVDLKLPELTPSAAAAAGAKTLLIGIAPSGGQLPVSWHRTLIEALEAGLDLAGGLHERLAEISAVAECAARYGRQIHDVRHYGGKLSVGTGKPRPGRRLLTVGTDCGVGKKYTALAIAKELVTRRRRADFRATGQTGILIVGEGIAVDAVAADFVAGAAEALSPANAPDHWDVIEGQGSLSHPAYAGVTLGLIHGSQPDALVLCHDPTRKHLNGFPGFPVLEPQEAMPGYLAAARLTSPKARFVGVALNTSSLSAAAAADVLARTEEITGLPCVDPIRNGVGPIVSLVEAFDAD